MVSGALGKISRLCPPPEWRIVGRRFPVNFFCFKIYLFNKWITTRYTEELASNNFGWGPRNSRFNGVVECHIKLRNAISICQCMHFTPYLSDNASNSCFCWKELQQAQTGKELFALILRWNKSVSAAGNYVHWIRYCKVNWLQWLTSLHKQKHEK